MLRPVCHIAFVLLTGLALLFASASSAAAQGTDGLDVSSSTTYVPDPENGEIRVASSYTLTNVQADRVVSDAVRSYFFTKWIIAIPANAADLVATANGQSLATTSEPDPDGTSVLFTTISLPANLNYQQTTTVDVTYTIPGGEPRSDGSIARVNDSFLSFSVWASGDPGQVDIRVAIPPGFSMELQGDIDVLERVSRDDEAFYEAVDISEPSEFFGQVFGRNDAGLITESAKLPGATATIRAWPDDPEWAAFVVDAIERDVPVIQELTGLAWPAGDIEVIETVTPYLYGYGGWFNASSGLIEIGDKLERDLILHELAHAWFNDDLIEGRWITEGLSEEYASRAIAETGGAATTPDTPDLDSPVRVQLAGWQNPWALDQGEAFEYEQFHYNASWWVIRQITDEIGLDEFGEILVALHNDEIAYPGEGPLETTQLSTQWMHFFDLLDHRTDVTQLDDLFATYVLGEQGRSQLTQRTSTLETYWDFVESTGEWGPPLAIRDPLSAWDFDEAENAMVVADTILEAREATDTLAAALDVRVEHLAEPLYEQAGTIDDLTAALSTETSLHAQLVELRDDRNDLDALAQSLGLQVMYPALPLQEAMVDVDAQRRAVIELGDLRTQVDSRADALALRSPAWPATSGPTDFAAAASLAEARLATLDAIEATATRVAEPRGTVARLGLWPRDPDESLADARAAFEADELADALDSAAEADTLLLQADPSGRRRIVRTAIGAVLFVILAIGAVYTVRSRRPQPVKNPPDG